MKNLRYIATNGFFSILVILPLLLSSCTNSADKAPDVSNIKIDLQSARFDIDFGSIDTNHIGEGLQKLYTKYPDFLNYYLDSFMACGINHNYTDTSRAVRDSLRPYLVYKDFVRLQDTIKKHYPDSKETDAMLTEGFRYLRYYFPGCPIPKVLYINSYLASKWPTFPLDNSTLCVGLDWFLGDRYLVPNADALADPLFVPFYASVGVPPYQVAHVRISYIPVSVFNSIYQATHPIRMADKTLLDLMIQHGKEQYFLHKILPHTADSVIFGFPQRKLDWCDKNEALIYNFFIHQSLLYNKEPANIMPYLNDGPFAANFPAADPALNTPGNIGTWLGYRIVCAYAAQNPKLTLQQLLDQQTDAAQFLDAAKYRPK